MRRIYLVVITLLLLPAMANAGDVFKRYNTNTADAIGPTNLVEYNGLLYFTRVGSNDLALCATDGTTAGTRVVMKLISNGWIPRQQLLVYKNRLYFIADDKIHGLELWSTDGTPAGTYMVSDVYQGKYGSFPNGFAVLNDTLYFYAYTVDLGAEPYATDGTNAGTHLVKDISPGGNSGILGDVPYVYDGKMYFTGLGGVYVSDGTAAGTRSLNGLFGYMKSPVGFKGRVYFLRDSILHFGLWATDGTDAGTHLFKDFDPTSPVDCGLDRVGIVYKNRLYFSAGDTAVTGIEPHSTDGTLASTVMLKNVAFGKKSSNICFSHECNGKLYGRGDDGVHGPELWVTDGTTAGTHMVKDVASPGSSAPSLPMQNIGITDVRAAAVYKNRLYYLGEDSVNGTSLWVTNGTDTGTYMLKRDTAHIFDVVNKHANFCEYKGSLYLGARFDGNSNYELWSITDTTGSNPTIVTGVNSEPVFAIYPNPNNGNFTMKISMVNADNNAMLKVYDALGKLVHIQSITQATTTLQLSHLPKAVYEAVLQQNDATVCERLVVQ